MSFGKRQLILAALVVSLGAAVYLNWQFSGDGEITTVDANASGQELGTAQLVNGSNIVSSESSDSSQSEETESTVASTDGLAESDSSDTVTESETETKETTGEVTDTQDYFSEAALSRQKTRDEAVEVLNQVLNDTEATEDETLQAVEESAAIARNMLSESNIESLVKSKGYTDCVAFIQNNECSVVVGKSSEFTEEDAATIRDIVVGQCDITYENIKIVDHVTG